MAQFGDDISLTFVGVPVLASYTADPPATHNFIPAWPSAEELLDFSTESGPNAELQRISQTGRDASH